MTPIPFPLENLSNEIDRAIGAGLYHLALVAALTIPDICCALAHEQGRTRGDRYEAWFDKYMKVSDAEMMPVPALTGKDCYRMRCGLSHEARLSRSPDGTPRTYDRFALGCCPGLKVAQAAA